MSKKTKFIRDIYLYLFSLVGLVLVVIAGVSFIDMGLKAWVFTKAEVVEKTAPIPIRLNNSEFLNGDALAKKILECDDECDLTEEEKESVKQWIVDYEDWKQGQKDIDYVARNRHRDAANSLAKLIVGLPLYLYHWNLASRKREDDDKHEDD